MVTDKNFFFFDIESDERVDRVIKSEGLRVGKISYETWLGADILFEKQEAGYWNITIYRRIRGTSIEVPLILACLVSITRFEKMWYKSTKRPYMVETRDFLLELNIKEQSETEIAEEVIYSIKHGIDYAFETAYALDKGYLTASEVTSLARYYQETSIDLQIAFQFLATMTALRNGGNDVSYFNELLITKRRYDMLQIVDYIESDLNRNEIEFDSIKNIFKLLYPNIDRMKKDINEISQQVLNHSPSDGMKYHLALSFAGEDRLIADKIAYALTNSGYKIFYDDFEKDVLWGKDLYVYLNDLYSKHAKYCLMIISASYKDKLWTNHERKAAQAKAFRQNEEYILPLRLDNTEIPGLNETVGYIDFNSIKFDELISLLKRKLNK